MKMPLRPRGHAGSRMAFGVFLRLPQTTSLRMSVKCERWPTLGRDEWDLLRCKAPARVFASPPAGPDAPPSRELRSSGRTRRVFSQARPNHRREAFVGNESAEGALIMGGNGSLGRRGP